MLVDDSGVVRKMVAHLIDREPDLEVVAQASDGREALETLNGLEIDLLVLDVEMPVLDGLGVLQVLRTARPELPVVMFTAETARAADLTLEALTLGARDFARKPRASDRDAGSAQVRTELIERIRMHGCRPNSSGSTAAAPQGLGSAIPITNAVKSAPSEGADTATSTEVDATGEQTRARDVSRGTFRTAAEAPRTAEPPAPLSARASGALPRPASGLGATGIRPRSGVPSSSGPIELVVIGCSTGGPVALATLLGALPPLQVPVLIVQHMPPLFTQRLAQRLDHETAHEVIEAQGGEELRGGLVVIAQGDRHLEVFREGQRLVTRLTQAPPENFCRPSVDVLFRSAAAVTGARTLAVVLTGMGDDGGEGAPALSAAGARLMAQDRATCVVFGMPGELERRRLPVEFLPISELGNAIHQRVQMSFARASGAA